MIPLVIMPMPPTDNKAALALKSASPVLLQNVSSLIVSHCVAPAIATANPAAKTPELLKSAIRTRRTLCLLRTPSTAKSLTFPGSGSS